MHKKYIFLAVKLSLRQILSFYFCYHYSIIFKNELKPNINQLIRLGRNEPTAFVHVWQPRTQKEVATLATTVSPVNQPVVHVTMENRFPRWRHNQLFLAPTRCIKPKLQVWFFNMKRNWRGIIGMIGVLKRQFHQIIPKEKEQKGIFSSS